MNNRIAKQLNAHSYKVGVSSRKVKRAWNTLTHIEKGEARKSVFKWVRGIKMLEVNRFKKANDARKKKTQKVKALTPKKAVRSAFQLSLIQRLYAWILRQVKGYTAYMNYVNTLKYASSRKGASL